MNHPKWLIWPMAIILGPTTHENVDVLFPSFGSRQLEEFRHILGIMVIPPFIRNPYLWVFWTPTINLIKFDDHPPTKEKQMGSLGQFTLWLQWPGVQNGVRFHFTNHPTMARTISGLPQFVRFLVIYKHHHLKKLGPRPKLGMLPEHVHVLRHLFSSAFFLSPIAPFILVAVGLTRFQQKKTRIPKKHTMCSWKIGNFGKKMGVWEPLFLNTLNLLLNHEMTSHNSSEFICFSRTFH